MNDEHKHDIDDDEIRIIVPGVGDRPSVQKHSGRRRGLALLWTVIALAVLCVAVMIAFYLNDSNPAGDIYVIDPPVEVMAVEPEVATEEQFAAVTPYTEVVDTVVGGVSLVVFTPMHATPGLVVGSDVLADTTAVLVAQAADLRRDNGGIVGAYVLDGELLSKGQSKSGFCAIINGEATIGVAEATPLLEQALDTDGCFFRQYPLVVANQVVENKPKGRALRKALADINGRISVVVSKDKLTFHDFSQALADLGVSNAIYLVGGYTYGFARNIDGKIVVFGTYTSELPGNTNYIVWR